MMPITDLILFLSIINYNNKKYACALLLVYIYTKMW